MMAATIDEGVTAFRAGDYEQCVTKMTQAISTLRSEGGASEMLSRALSNRSAAFAKLGRWSEALEDANAASNISPCVAKYHARVGTALEGLKRLEEAAVAYHRASQLDSCSDYAASCERLRGSLMAGKGVSSDASRQLHNMQKQIDRGNEALKQNRPDEAISCYERALACELMDSSSRCKLLANLSAALLKAHLVDEAIDACRQSIALDSSYPRAHMRAALAFKTKGSFVEAMKHIVEAERLDPLNDTVLTEKRAIQQALDAQLAAQRAKDATLAEIASAVQTGSSKVDNSAPLSVALPPQDATAAIGSRHTVSYEYCRLCSEYGHVAKHCPLRKRTRES